MRGLREFRQLTLGITLGLLVFAVGNSAAASSNLSHSYKSTTTLKVGSLVSLDPNQKDFVKLANKNNAQQLVGIAVAVDDSLLAVDQSPEKVQVAISGTANVLVSTLNGAIRVGDQVAVSPFNGIGMKASPGSQVVGLARTSFDSQTTGSSSEEVKNSAGKTQQILVGYGTVGIAIGSANNQAGTSNINGLQKIAKSLTGHVVSTLRIILSFILAVVALSCLITLVYSSIYSTIISVGRNPLAKNAVFRTLGAVVGLSFSMAGLAAFAIFLLLR
ncbi:MAG: hypothetical protein NVS1B10_06870 [Candidatus Saccharimonadales bacterium]